MRRRLRQRDPGRFLAKDAKAWRRLVKAARCQVRAPLASAEPLRKAADACGASVPPPGHARRDSDFLALLTIGRMWWRLPPEAQRAQADKLTALADACSAALDAAGGEARPPRLDIFG